MNEQITERPAEKQHGIQLAPTPARSWWRWPLTWAWQAKVGYGLLALVGILAFAVSLGFLPRWEEDGPIDHDAIVPVDLAALFTTAERYHKEPKVWPPKDDVSGLEAPVQRLVDNVRHGTGKHVSMPVTFSNANVTTAERIELSGADGSVLIGKELVRVSFANHCVIICPGVVDISHSYNNIVIAGQYIHASHEGGTFGGLIGSPERSVLACARTVNVSFARDTVILAPRADVAHAHRAVFLHRRGGNLSHAWWCRYLSPPNVLTPAMLPPDPLAGAVEYLGMKNLDQGKGRAARLREPNTDKEILLAEGMATAEQPLKGWRLVYAGNETAVLSDGKQWSVLPLAKSPGKRRTAKPPQQGRAEKLPPG